MIRYLILIFLFAAAPGCTRKSSPERGTDEFLFSEKAAPAATLPWKDWSAATFAEAQSSGKPVFLSLTRSLCSWCTLLDETTLSNPRVGELLRNKFILIRVNADIYPEIGNRFGAEGIPRLAILTDKADLLWDTGFARPTQLNQTLHGALRKELEVKLRTGQMRYDPNPDHVSEVPPEAEYPFKFLQRSIFDFDNENKGYQAKGKALSFSRLEFDLKLSVVEWGRAENRIMLDTHLDSVFAHLHDPHDGGFLTGSYDVAWNDFIPVKRADEQAAMAAFLSAYAYWAQQGIPLARPAKEVSAVVESTVAYLEQRLIDSGKIFTGEMGTREYYLSNRRGSVTGTQTNSVLQTSVAARVADKLAEAGYWSGNQEWITKGAQIARSELDQRTPNGLFWHVKDLTRNRLEDAAAMLGAMISLYTATGDDAWLREAESIATAMEQLYSPQGYYLDATGGSTAGFQIGEPMPMLNLITARSLFYLAIITHNRTWGLRAEKIARQFAISTVVFVYDEAAHAQLVWQLSNPVFRLEVPRAWRGNPAAEKLIRPTSTLVLVRWIDGNEGKVCYEDKCSKPFGEPEKLGEASLTALATTAQSPGKANLKNPFFK